MTLQPAGTRVAVTLQPTAPGERSETLDILRGVALLGVLLENLQHFVSPSYAAWVVSPDASALDRLAYWLIVFTCDNKVYLLFAFLFGYGIALQMARTAAGLGGFVTLHLWRMGTLLLIGLAHALVWNGDILTTFALLGVLLLPLRGASDRALGAVAVLGLALPFVLRAGVMAWAGGAGLAPTPWKALEAEVAALGYPIRQGCFVFAALALGLAAGRANRLAEPVAFLASARRFLPAALTVGLVANLVTVTVMRGYEGTALSPGALLLEATMALGAPTLAFVFVYVTLWCLERPAPKAWLRPCAAVGRTTLSNYLLQSVIGMGVLLHTGLGPLGPITPPVGIVLTLVIFGAQVAASRWWLARFRFGPAEWLWRSLTYASRQPMRTARPA